MPQSTHVLVVRVEPGLSPLRRVAAHLQDGTPILLGLVYAGGEAALAGAGAVDARVMVTVHGDDAQVHRLVARLGGLGGVRSVEVLAPPAAPAAAG